MRRTVPTSSIVGSSLVAARRLLALLCAVVLLSTPALPARTESGPVTPPAPAPASGLSAGVAPIPAFRQAKNLAVITIRGEINGVTAHSVKRRIEAAIAGGADAITIELDTPGGEVNSVIDICQAIKGCGKHTIAWVHPNAYSGGAIIALACREIVVSPGATMGDAAPISPGLLGMGWIQGLHRTERAKALAPVLAEIIDSARQNGYDEKLVQSLVSLDVELWMVEEISTGKRHFLTEAEYRKLFGESPDRSTPIAPTAGNARKGDPLGTPEQNAQADQPLKPAPRDGTAFKPASPSISNEVINSVNDETSGLTQVSRRPEFKPEDRDNYRVLGYATDGTSLLTIKETTIKDFGLAVQTIASDSELQAFTGAQHLRRMEQTWGESFASTLDVTSAWGMLYRGVLIVVFLIALFMELSMPGASVPGVVALLALGGLMAPSLLIGASAWWALVAIGLGLVLLMLEIFVLPGFGVAGISGLLLLLAGLVGTFAEVGELFPGAGGDRSDLTWAVSVVLLAFFSAGVGMFLFSKYTRSFPIAGRMVLGNARPADDGEGLLAAMSASAPTDAPVRVGQTGLTTTALRPSGTAEFDGKLVDVVAEFGFIERGRSVRVVDTSFRVSVEEVTTPTPPAEGRA